VLIPDWPNLLNISILEVSEVFLVLKLLHSVNFGRVGNHSLLEIAVEMIVAVTNALPSELT